MSIKVLSVLPIRNEDLYEQYKKAKGCFWDVSELDLSKDKQDWETLSDGEKFFLENILAFFSQSDQLVNTNLEERFLQDINALPDDTSIYCKLFYNFQKMMEDIHSITYETLLHTYISDKSRLNTLKSAIANVPAIGKKAAWAKKWIDSSESFGKRLIAFAVLEGIFFSGSFCAIFWIRERGILKGLTKSNEFISRDEGMHYTFAISLFKAQGGMGCSNEDIVTIVKEAVEIETSFITESFKCDLIGMNSREMSKYIEYVADFMLQQLGLPKVYNTKNPFIFMENIGLLNKTNFFEQRVTDYKKANSAEGANAMLSMDDFF